MFGVTELPGRTNYELVKIIYLYDDLQVNSPYALKPK